jgi:hypothetical protein
MGIEVKDTGAQFVNAGLVQPALEARSDMAVFLVMTAGLSCVGGRAPISPALPSRVREEGDNVHDESVPQPGETREQLGAARRMEVLRADRHW